MVRAYISFLWPTCGDSSIAIKFIKIDRNESYHHGQIDAYPKSLLLGPPSANSHVNQHGLLITAELCIK